MDWYDSIDILYDGDKEQIEKLVCPTCGNKFSYSFCKDPTVMTIHCKYCGLLSKAHGGPVPNCVKFFGNYYDFGKETAMGTVRKIAGNELPVENKRKKQNTNWYEVMRDEMIRKLGAKAMMTENVNNAITNMTRMVMAESGNKVFSPTAFYMALIILSQLTEGDTRSQILKVLGIDRSEVLEVYYALKTMAETNCEEATSKTASSIWLNESVEFDEDLLKRLQKFYGLASYAGTMGSPLVNKAITNWLNETTENMLTKETEISTSPDMLLDLFSTVYFRANWDHEFEDSDVKPGTFTLQNGNKIDCTMMGHSTHAMYHVGKSFTAMSKELTADYTAVFVLPNKGVTLEELMDDSQVQQLVYNGSIVGSEACEVKFAMPKFSVACKLNLIDIMENLGITNVFSSDSADFSPISKSEKMALSKAEQTTRIKMTENGVEAASFVEMSVMELGIPPKYRRVKFILNRPFLFYIVASNAMPIFAGKLLDPRENEETMSEE